jgi:hypothetical protein
MSVTTLDLTEFVNKKVVLVRNLAKPNDKGETAEELEGTLVAVAGDALMFKPKGKTNALLIDTADVESVNFAQEKAKTLTRKTLKIVTHGQARTHLLERHAFTLTAINAMSETDAFKLHNEIDHEGSDLGHIHGEKPSKDEAGDDSDD